MDPMGEADMTLVIWAVIVGVMAGILSGLIGIGGGIVIVPALVLLGLTQREASGTSLAALLLPVGLLGVMEYAHRNEVKLNLALALAVGLLAGAFVGARVAGQLPNAVLQRGFGVLLLIVAVRFLLLPLR